MKQLLVIAAATLLYACGGSSKPEKTAEEEMVTADSISQVIEGERADLSSKTEETLTEVDSLLETL